MASKRKKVLSPSPVTAAKSKEHLADLILDLQQLRISISYSIYSHKGRAGPFCLLQHPCCPGENYCNTARPSFAPLQCWGSTHCSRGTSLPAGTLPPHSQQDQLHRELEEVCVGQRNRFRWDLLGAARHVITIALCAQINLSIDRYNSHRHQLEKDSGAMQENDGSYFSYPDFCSALCQRERHVYLHSYHGASGLFQHSQQWNVHSLCCTVQKKHVIYWLENGKLKRTSPLNTARTWFNIHWSFFIVFNKL